MTNQNKLLLSGGILWFALMYWLGSRGAFMSGPNQPPVGIASAFAIPIVLFLVAVSISATWRATVVSIPPIFLISLNGWRFIGLGFLMGYAEGLLPGGFAWPAGLGDIFMAVTAPWVAARVAADDRFRFGPGFLVWNLLGIADFVDAVFWGTLYMWPGYTAGGSTTLMQRLPFVLIPTFFVPLVAIGHFTLLQQRRNAAYQAKA